MSLLRKLCITALSISLTLSASSCSKKKGADSVSSGPPTVNAQSVVTSWLLGDITNGSTSSNSTPTLSGDFTFDGATITVYLNSSCTGVPAATAVVSNGIFTISSISLSPDGDYSFYYTVTDTLHNTTSCLDSGLSYTLDTTPTAPTLGTVPTYATSSSITLPVTSCNNSISFLISTTQPLASDPQWATCSTTTGIATTLGTEGLNTVTIWGLSLDGKVSAHSTSVTITRDTTPPTAPSSWAMSSPTNGSISNNTSPSITGAETEDGTIVKLYTASNCSNTSRVGQATVASGAFSIPSFTLTQDGAVAFYYTISDPAGNELACASTGLSYTLDTTAPTSPGVIINSGDANTNFRSVTLSLSATETVSLPMEMCVIEGTSCSGCVWATFTGTKAVTMSNTTGLKTISAKFRDSLGNTSSCVQSTITLAALSVAARYSAAAEWNDYVRASDTTTACDGSEASQAACIHGGEHRRVTTARTSCTSLTMTDSLGIFDWSCNLVSGAATFDSTLKSDKGLRDLVNATSWKDNYVTLSYGSQTATSTAAPWWTNSVIALSSNSGTSVDALTTASGIYTLAASASTSGYNITADKIGVVTLGNSVLSWNGGAAGGAENCSSVDGSTTFPDKRCILATGSHNFLWFESALDGGSSNASDYGIFATGMSFSVFRNTFVNNQIDTGIFIDSSSNHNLLTDIRTSNNTVAGITLNAGPSDNIFLRLLASNNGSYGIHLLSASNNSITQSIASSNGSGFFIENGNNNALTSVTSVNNSNRGFGLKASSSNVISNAVAANSAIGLHSFANSNANTFAQIVATNNDTGIYLQTSSLNKFTGNLLVGNNSSANCSTSGGTRPGLVNSNCTLTGTSLSSTYPAGYTSDAVLLVSLSAANSFIGKATSDSANTSAPGSGAASYATTLDWTHFSNSARSWGADGSAFPSLSNRGRCSSGTCRIWDWSLSSSDDVLLNLSGDGMNPNDPVISGNCPSQTDGNEFLTIGSTHILTNAVELPDSSTGNHNGLCESGESCLYTPNFGAYQGHGTPQTCTFHSGTITGVTLYWYPSNGR